MNPETFSALLPRIFILGFWGGLILLGAGIVLACKQPGADAFLLIGIALGDLLLAAILAMLQRIYGRLGAITDRRRDEV